MTEEATFLGRSLLLILRPVFTAYRLWTFAFQRFEEAHDDCGSGIKSTFSALAGELLEAREINYWNSGECQE